MKLENGLLSLNKQISFEKYNNAFNDAILQYPDYSLLISFLRFRFYDCYDMIKFIENLDDSDKINNTEIYQRKTKELNIILNRLYGPFFSGNKNDNLLILDDLAPLDKIIFIINNSKLNNQVLQEMIYKSNTDNLYDFYISLYLQKTVNFSLKYEHFSLPIEEDEEYVLWNYSNLRYEQNNLKTLDLTKIDKNQYFKLINQYTDNEINDENEPNDLNEIIKQSNFKKIQYEVLNYKDRLKGAIIGRFIGCMLGAPVENFMVEKMEQLAIKQNMQFPPIEYWHEIDNETYLHYKRDKKIKFTKDNMTFVVADDDVTYTVLNALILHKYGLGATSEDFCKYWFEHLPYGCTAEYKTLIGLKRNYSIEKIVNTNPFVELIGASIRADVFGYIYKGDPYNAAISAYKDACISHKRNGIYGEMFLAAAIALSFVKNNVIEAIKEAINYIPKNCRLTKDIKWALSYQNKISDYKHANLLIQNRFKHMNRVHTNNNMCAIIFALFLGDNDFNKTISNCIAIGYDNDCTGATIGSLLGANIAIDKISTKWYQDFNNEIHTYIRGYETISIDNLINIILEISKNV